MARATDKQRGAREKARWPMDRFLPYRISLVATGFRQAIAALYKPALGVSENEWKVLVTVAHHGPLASSAVGAYLTLDRMSVSRGLTRLVALGLVNRRRYAGDQRVFEVGLTKKGETRFAPLAQQVLRLEQQALQHFTAREKRDLLRLLDKVQEALQD